MSDINVTVQDINYMVTVEDQIVKVVSIAQQGPQGIQGIQGPQGNTGPQGLQGIQGPAGADGANFSGLSFTYPAGDVFASTTAFAAIPAPATKIYTTIRGVIGSAPTGADIVIDIHKNGVTVFTDQATRPKILAGTTTCTLTGLSLSLAAGDKVEWFIDQVGSTLPGTGPMGWVMT